MSGAGPSKKVGGMQRPVNRPMKPGQQQPLNRPARPGAKGGGRQKDPDYRDIRVMIGEPHVEVRNSIRAAFQVRGFRNILDCQRVSHIRDAASQDMLDLIICDHQMPEGELNDLVRGIRHHEIGHNPFLVVITTISEADRNAIAAIIDSGADDLVAKPLSPGLLIDRIVMLTFKRKDFVVTTDYVGPDRRKDKTREGSEEIPQMAVPNVLKAKAVDGMGEHEFSVRMKNCVRQVNEQKMERHANQISWLVDRINPMYLMGMADEEVVPLLNKLVYTAEDISRRLVGTRYDHVGELCQSMVDLAQRIQADPYAPSPKDVKLLPEMAEAIRHAFDPTSETVNVARDISRTVAGGGRT